MRVLFSKVALIYNVLSEMNIKIYESSRVIDRGTSAHFCVSDQYLISKVLRMKEVNYEKIMKFNKVRQRNFHFICHLTIF